MSNIPISVCGTVATVPNSRTLPTGRACASFRLAVNHWRVDKTTGKYVSDTTSWFGVDCYGQLAGNVGTSLTQGMTVLVLGQLRIREWETEERSGIAPTIIADHLGPDLRFGTAHFQRSHSPARAQQSEASDERGDSAWGSLSSEAASAGAGHLDNGGSGHTGLGGHDAGSFGAGAGGIGSGDPAAGHFGARADGQVYGEAITEDENSEVDDHLDEEGDDRSEENDREAGGADRDGDSIAAATTAAAAPF